MAFVSQWGQDKWVVGLLEEKKNGFFVDVGAFDGVESDLASRRKYA
jgi:hypothetical protein